MAAVTANGVGDGDTDQFDDHSAYTDSEGRRFEVTALVAERAGVLGIVGLLALQVGTGPRTRPPPQLCQEVARSLVERGDVGESAPVTAPNTWLTEVQGLGAARRHECAAGSEPQGTRRTQRRTDHGFFVSRVNTASSEGCFASASNVPSTSVRLQSTGTPALV